MIGYPYTYPPPYPPYESYPYVERVSVLEAHRRTFARVKAREIVQGMPEDDVQAEIWLRLKIEELLNLYGQGLVGIYGVIDRGPHPVMMVVEPRWEWRYLAPAVERRERTVPKRTVESVQERLLIHTFEEMAELEQLIENDEV